MNLIENIREGIRSIRSNLLRSILTMLIITIGITCLVGILTAVDSIQAKVNDSFADLGANSFEITVPSGGRRRFGQRIIEKTYPPIDYREAKAYKDRYKYPAQVSLSVSVSGSAEVKYQSTKTNPNISVIGGNEYYLQAESLDLEYGRNFSNIEQKQGTFAAIIGSEIAEKLFKDTDPINELITVRDYKFKVVGVLESEGASQGGSGDRRVIIPLESARVLLNTSNPSYEIQTLLDKDTDFSMAMGEATSLMRQIRRDPLNMPDSFEIERSETLAERLSSITGYMKLGGGVVGFITLLGAAIGLMNIMMVSVTERTREIGVRKALGATPARIREQFLIEAVVICQLGGFAGIFLGLTVGNILMSYLGAGRFIVPWMWIITAMITCVVVGILSGFYPAYKASRLDPIESLRFE